jgi:alpha-mannosidase
VQFLLRDDDPPESAPVTDLTASETLLANGHVRVELDPSGVRWFSVDGHSLLGERGIRLHLRHDHTDTWTFRTDRFDEPVDTALTTDGWVVEETGPLRARVRTEGWLGRSWTRWTLSLHRADPRLHILLEVNFAERYKALQMPIHLAGSPSRWTDGLAGGMVERQPNPAEWPVLGWSRVDVNYQSLALLTHDAYSLSLQDSSWQWTLLRSPRMSWGGRDPEVHVGRHWHTDQGPHAFAIALHPGAPLDAAMLETASRHLAQLPVVFDRYEGLNRSSWGAQAPRRLWTGAEHRAEKAGRLPLPIDERGSDPFL